MRFQTGYYFKKGMVVQQDFEKGRSQRLWFRRYDRYKTSHFFQGLTLGAEGGGACTRYFTVLNCEKHQAVGRTRKETDR